MYTYNAMIQAFMYAMIDFGDLYINNDEQR